MASNAIHILTIPPSREVAEQGLPPALRDWFAPTSGRPHWAQRYACAAILNRQHLSCPLRPPAAKRWPRSCRSSAKSQRRQ